MRYLQWVLYAVIFNNYTHWQGLSNQPDDLCGLHNWGSTNAIPIRFSSHFPKRTCIHCRIPPTDTAYPVSCHRIVTHSLPSKFLAYRTLCRLTRIAQTSVGPLHLFDCFYYWMFQRPDQVLSAAHLPSLPVFRTGPQASQPGQPSHATQHQADTTQQVLLLFHIHI